ncbi:MAG: AIR synthase family protein, partial [candidate division Zixibacteria bacterium]|nr:AIR synthase family protein [candidate division Zixibacteria bacterium]
MDKPYPVGKLPTEDLERILRRYACVSDPRVLIGPGVGRDAAAISFGATTLVAKSDPITFATERLGWYAVHVNANDIAVMGAVPKWFMATLLLPEGATTPALIDGIFSGLSEACQSLGVTLCGGHTEITYGLTRPIVAGHMMGETETGRLVSAADAKTGDDIVLTKGIAIEGVAVLAVEKETLLRQTFPSTFVNVCRAYLDTPGISVVAEARIAMQHGGVHAMHDPTEGGLATGFREVCAAANVGGLIFADRIPVLPETETLCRLFGLDPLGLIASGALILAVAPDRSLSLV